jgi:hypothetical protein
MSITRNNVYSSTMQTKSVTSRLLLLTYTCRVGCCCVGIHTAQCPKLFYIALRFKYFPHRKSFQTETVAPCFPSYASFCGMIFFWESRWSQIWVSCKVRVILADMNGNETYPTNFTPSFWYEKSDTRRSHWRVRCNFVWSRQHCALWVTVSYTRNWARHTFLSKVTRLSEVRGVQNVTQVWNHNQRSTGWTFFSTLDWRAGPVQ